MVFFYIGIHCCLRGGQEQKDLSVEQFQRFPSSGYDHNTYYKYTEYISKNNLHRFKDVHSKNKTVLFPVQPSVLSYCWICICLAFLRVPKPQTTFMVQDKENVSPVCPEVHCDEEEEKYCKTNAPAVFTGLQNCVFNFYNKE